MKLIVLYGPENSGKTTTLKMVYEVLKKHNSEEQRRFEYLDRNRYNDFRDVLKLKTSDLPKFILTKDSSPSQSSNATQDEEIPIFDEDNDLDEHFPDDIAQNEDDECDDVDEYDDIDDNYDSNKENLEDIHSINTIVDKTQLVVNMDERKIGIILEGDWVCRVYHCIHGKHNRLCDNIQDLEDCDIIICACSIRSKTKNQPSDCIKWAIKHYHAQYAVVKTRSILKGKPTAHCLPIEKRFANVILRTLTHIW